MTKKEMNSQLFIMISSDYSRINSQQYTYIYSLYKQCMRLYLGDGVVK